MDKEAPSSAGVAAEAALCEECGKALGEAGIAFYDGRNWRGVHAACVPEEGPPTL